jgi:hypothetical protein
VKRTKKKEKKKKQELSSLMRESWQGQEKFGEESINLPDLILAYLNSCLFHWNASDSTVAAYTATMAYG